MQIIEALNSAASQFDSDSARLDAELLLCEVLSCNRTYLFTWPDKALADESLSLFESLVERRAKGEPIAHILGFRQFWTLDLAVTPDTLIPRPDTELLVELALDLMPKSPKTVLDLGTGTGAIGLSIASERSDWHVFLLDRFIGAAQLAERNRQAHNITNASILCGSWADAIAAESVDMIVSNPPYIDQNDPHLAEGDVRFEPHTALVADNNGLADIETITEQAKTRLKAGGVLLFEHGFEQAEAVQAILRNNGFERVTSHKDLAGQPRATLGFKEGV